MNDKIKYYYIDGSGILAGSTFINPRDPLPERQGTITPPPDISEGEIAVFKNGIWKVTNEPEISSGERAIWNGQDWDIIITNPPKWNSVAEHKNTLKKELASRRWEAESAGTSINGITVHTDERTKSNIAGAALAAILDENYTVKWKTSSGDFITLNAQEIIGIAQAIRSHVQACFDREAILLDKINAGTTHNKLNKININTGWPS